MNEDKLKSLLESDANLREAIRQDEMERPQMPADLNERLMQRVAKQQPAKRRTLWPWVAAACVAGVMMVLLTPPKEAPQMAEAEQPQPAEVKMEAKKADEAPEIKKIKVAKKADRKLLAKQAKRVEVEAKPTAPKAEEAKMDLAIAETPAPKAETKPVVLTERDIPVTRPENYKYTPEELAQLKKQAAEAYLKWVELEMEISRNNLQTAQAKD